MARKTIQPTITSEVTAPAVILAISLPLYDLCIRPTLEVERCYHNLRRNGAMDRAAARDRPTPRYRSATSICVGLG
jgi:hypothetical protein